MTFPKIFSILAAIMILAATLPAQEDTETTYQPEEAPEQKAAEAEAAKPASTETRYNPLGTFSESEVALLTTRRKDAQFPGFLLGLQDAAIDINGEPLNVAPAGEEKLEEQHKALREEGAEVFLVDSPDPTKARSFLQNIGFLEINAVLITQEVPSGLGNVPVVIHSPLHVAERVAEESIRQVGNEEVTVAFVTSWDPEEAEEGSLEARVLKMFQKPFETSAPKIELVNVRLEEMDDEENPAEGAEVVCTLMPEDSDKLLPRLPAAVPDAEIVLAGESDKLREAFESEVFDVRVYPNYSRILQYALQESREKSRMPPVVLPTADKNQ